jgi:hypothetical protein
VALLEHELETSGPSARTATSTDASFRAIRPVRWWAALGGAVLLVQAAILVRWITGPYFHSVSSGPTPVPGWMKLALVAIQVALPAVGLGIIYTFAVRPWRRERRLSSYGLMVIAFSTLWFQDPLSAYAGQWYSYNAWQLNMGSWVNSVPGWLSPGTPSHQVAFPLLVVPGAYIAIFLLVTFLGSQLMAQVKARRPQTGRIGLVLSCFVAMAVFDVLFEGIVFMPLGSWEYPGGRWAIFASTFHKYPLNEAITTGMLFTAFACIKYFVDARGQTLAERGADGLKGTPARAWTIRALAMTGLVSLTMLLCYNVPNFFVGLHATNWPRAIQQRSYLTYTCGAAAHRPCPPSAVTPGGNNGG